MIRIEGIPMVAARLAAAHKARFRRIAKIAAGGRKERL